MNGITIPLSDNLVDFILYSGIITAGMVCFFLGVELAEKHFQDRIKNPL